MPIISEHPCKTICKTLYDRRNRQETFCDKFPQIAPVESLSPLWLADTHIAFAKSS